MLAKLIQANLSPFLRIFNNFLNPSVLPLFCLLNHNLIWKMKLHTQNHLVKHTTSFILQHKYDLCDICGVKRAWQVIQRVSGGMCRLINDARMMWLHKCVNWETRRITWLVSHICRLQIVRAWRRVINWLNHTMFWLANMFYSWGPVWADIECSVVHIFEMKTKIANFIFIVCRSICQFVLYWIIKRRFSCCSRSCSSDFNLIFDELFVFSLIYHLSALTAITSKTCKYE